MKAPRICEHCGTVGEEVTHRPGSGVVTVALLLLGIVTITFTFGVVLLAWLAYEIWRVVKTERVCPSCGQKKSMVALDSPLGRKLWAAQRGRGSPQEEVPQRPATKTCPYCAEDIKVEAILCRFCGKNLSAA